MTCFIHNPAHLPAQGIFVYFPYPPRGKLLIPPLQESGLLQSASPFYKTFAIECSRAQVSVDMFLFSAAYQDVATLGELWL